MKTMDFFSICGIITLPENFREDVKQWYSKIIIKY